MSTQNLALPNLGHGSAAAPGTDALTAGTSAEALSGWHARAYRCCMAVMWLVLALFFALVIYNTLFATAPPTSEAPIYYAYPTPPT
jgi:hypothetical protein